MYLAMVIEIKDQKSTLELGQKIGQSLVGGEIIELIGDVGAGKTVIAKGIALGLGIKQTIASPSFTISQLYEARDGLRLAHYDFYRLADAGLMMEELRESISSSKTIAIIEWGDIIKDVLPDTKITITIKPLSETSRLIEILPEGALNVSLD